MEELNLTHRLSPLLYAQLNMLISADKALANNLKVHLLSIADENCFVYRLDKNDISSIKDIKIYGLFKLNLNGNGSLEDYLEMEVGVKLQSSGTPLEIKTINAGKLKRSGRGSQAIKFLENTLIPEINEILHSHNYSGIEYIYGISAELSPETNALARAKFYSRNGFTISHSHFYKYL